MSVSTRLTLTQKERTMQRWHVLGVWVVIFCLFVVSSLISADDRDIGLRDFPVPVAVIGKDTCTKAYVEKLVVLGNNNQCNDEAYIHLLEDIGISLIMLADKCQQQGKPILDEKYFKEAMNKLQICK